MHKKLLIIRAPEGAAAAAPTIAPVPTPTPSPSPAPSPSPDPTPDDGKDSFEKFDSFNADLPAPPTPKPTAPPSPAKVEVPPEPKTDDLPPETPPAPALAKPADDAPPQFKTNKELRTWAYEQHKSAKELAKKVADLEKIKSVVDNKNPQSDAEKQALLKKSEDLQKRIDDYEAKVRLLDYEQSEEYKTKYLTPYLDARNEAQEILKQLVVTETNPETGEENERAAVWLDFTKLYDLPLGHQVKEAKKLFGDAAHIVLQHIDSVKKTVKAEQKAKAEYATKHQEIEKVKLAEQLQQQEQGEAHKREIAGLWSKVNLAMANDPRGQAFWGEEKDDKAANEALAKGFAFANKRFNGEYDKLPISSRVEYDAAVRHRVAGFYKLAHVVNGLKAQLAEKDDTIAKLRGSAPGKPAIGGDAPPADDNDSPLEKFDKL